MAGVFRSLLFLLAGACASAESASVAPAREPTVDGGGELAEAQAPPKPEFCVAAAGSGLQDITGTPQAPYFVHQPEAGTPSPDTLVFVPGGPGSRDTARTSFALWLSRGSTLGKLRVVVPYAADGDLTNEGSRIVPILDEVLACYGGNAARVHLAGTSNGGRAAFAAMLRSPDRFVTLLGAPGLFQATDGALTAALAGKAVFNGVGSLDAEWRPLVKATHDRLVTLKVESEYVELPGQGHILSSTADQEPFFAFWTHH